MIPPLITVGSMPPASSMQAIIDVVVVFPWVPVTAMVELLANVYANRLFHDELRVRELDTLQHLVSTVSVKVAATGAQPHLIPRFCEVLLDDLRCA